MNNTKDNLLIPVLSNRRFDLRVPVYLGDAPKAQADAASQGQALNPAPRPGAGRLERPRNGVHQRQTKTQGDLK
jgi:hypothetical protein